MLYIQNCSELSVWFCEQCTKAGIVKLRHCIRNGETKALYFLFCLEKGMIVS